MSFRKSSLVSAFAVSLIGAAVGCSSTDPVGTRFGGAGAGGSSGGAGSPGTGATSGGGASTGSGGQGGGGGFDLPDSSPQEDSSSLTQSDAACAADKRDSTPIKKDIIVLFDNSSSMACSVTDPACTNAPPGSTDTRMMAVTKAINDFVNAPASADIGVGLDPFPPADPLASQCDHDYATPDIPIAPASTNAAQFGTVLAGLTPHLNTPTEQALTGSYTAAKTYIAANPDRHVAVVLVTDGMPFACNNDKTGVVSAGLAKAAFEGTPSIETYVVGLGNVATLDAIALAGSGGVTHYIDANGTTATQKILDLLKAVSSMITCDYNIPTGGAALNYGLVNVEAKIGAAGTVEKVYNVKDASGCTAAKGGWFYNVNPPATPSKITLCTETCDPLKAAAGSTLQVLIGCATEPAPIK